MKNRQNAKHKAHKSFKTVTETRSKTQSKLYQKFNSSTSGLLYFLNIKLSGEHLKVN